MGGFAVRPKYAEAFRCVGPVCEDSCCVGWSVYFDEAAWNKYQSIAPGPLRGLIDTSVVRLDADAQTPGWFARVQMPPERRCPFLNGEKLCQIQVEHGEEYLSTTCATYPRIRHVIDGVEERSLSLSCPEAARLVLLAPELAGDFCELPDEGDVGRPDAPLLRHFWMIRAFVLELLTNRAYELWQRLFLLGLFARRVDGLSGEPGADFSAVIRDFRAAIASGELRPAMEGIPANAPMQLEMVLQLASLQLPRAHVGERFQQTARAFADGIGCGPDSNPTIAVLSERYAEAYERYYAPFFARHGSMLENLLINAVFRSLFPFGHKAGLLQSAPKMEREFALLATQFALYKGLLIGVAGFHREAFAAEHVVMTVQSASKHFEHHPQFLDEAHALLSRAGRDDVRGLVTLLRN